MAGMRWSMVWGGDRVRRADICICVQTRYTLARQEKEEIARPNLRSPTMPQVPRVILSCGRAGCGASSKGLHSRKRPIIVICENEKAKNLSVSGHRLATCATAQAVAETCGT